MQVVKLYLDNWKTGYHSKLQCKCSWNHPIPVTVNVIDEYIGKRKEFLIDENGVIYERYLSYSVNSPYGWRKTGDGR